MSNAYEPGLPEDAADAGSPAAPLGETPNTDPAAGSPPSPAPARSGSAATTAARKRDWEKVRNTRASSAWVGLIVSAVALVLLLVFILQNLDSTPLHVFFWEWNMPQGVAILFAAIIGALLTGLIGGARILQLRRVAKK